MHIMMLAAPDAVDLTTSRLVLRPVRLEIIHGCFSHAQEMFPVRSCCTVPTQDKGGKAWRRVGLYTGYLRATLCLPNMVSKDS